MGEGISYTFNIEPGQTGSKLDALIDTLGSLNATLSKTDSAFKKTDEHAKKAEHGFRGVGSAIDGARESLRHMAEFTGGMLLFEGIEKGIDLVAELGKEAINAAAQAERLDLSFELTMGAESAKDILGYVERIQSKTEFTDDQLKGWTLSLRNAGLMGDDLYKSLVAAADVAGRRGPQAMETAIDALSRANLTGKVEGRVLRGLGIPIAQLTELDKFKGLSDKQINKKLENVSITKDELLQVIAGPDKMLGDLAEKAGQTMNAKLKNVRTLPEQYFQKFAESPAYDRLKTTLDDVFANLDPESPRGQQIFSALETAFTGVVDMVGEIDVASIADTIANDIVPAMKTFEVVVEETFGFVKGIGSVLDTVSDLLPGSTNAKDIPKTMEETKLDNLYQLQVGKLRAQREALKAGKADSFALSPQDRALPGKDRIARQIADLSKPAGGNITDGFVQALADGKGFSYQAGFDLGVASHEGTRAAIDAHSPSRKFRSLGMTVPQGYSEGVRDGAPLVERAVDDTFAPPQLRGAGSRTVAASGGGVTIGSLSVTIQGAHDAAEIPPAVAAAVKAEIMRTLEDVRAERGT